MLKFDLTDASFLQTSQKHVSATSAVTKNSEEIKYQRKLCINIEYTAHQLHSSNQAHSTRFMSMIQASTKTPQHADLALVRVPMIPVTPSVCCRLPCGNTILHSFPAHAPTAAAVPAPHCRTLPPPPPPFLSAAGKSPVLWPLSSKGELDNKPPFVLSDAC